MTSPGLTYAANQPDPDLAQFALDRAVHLDSELIRAGYARADTADVLITARAFLEFLAPTTDASPESPVKEGN